MPGVSLSTEAVWTELYAGIRGFVARRVRQQADVDDVVQRVFLQVHRALPTLRETDKLHAWVYQTTRRAIADFYRTPSQNREVATGTAEDIAQSILAIHAMQWLSGEIVRSDGGLSLYSPIMGG